MVSALLRRLVEAWESFAVGLRSGEGWVTTVKVTEIHHDPKWMRELDSFPASGVCYTCAHDLEDGSGFCHAWKYQNIIDGRLYEYGHHSCLTFAQKDQP